MSWNGFWWKACPEGHTYIDVAPARDNSIGVDAMKVYMKKPFRAKEIADLIRYGNVCIYPREEYGDGNRYDVFKPYADCVAYDTADKIRGKAMENRAFLVERYKELSIENPKDENLFECYKVCRTFMENPVFYTAEDVDEMFRKEIEEAKIKKGLLGGYPEK